MALRFSQVIRPAWWTAGFLVLGLSLRLYHYGRNPSLWHDEAALVLNVLGKGFRELLGPLFFAEAAPPLFLWIEKAVSLFLGDGTYALRLIPFLASCMSLVLMVPIAQRLLHARAVPWALMLFACSDQLLWHTCEAKPYAVDVLATTIGIAVYCFTEPWPLGRRLLVLALLSPCLIFLDYPGCFVCGGLLVAILPAVWQARRAEIWLGYGLFAWAVLGAFALLLAGPAYAQRHPAMAQCWQNAFPSWERPWSVPLWTVVQTLEVFRYCSEPLGQVYAGLAVIGTMCLWRRQGRARTVLLVLPLALALVASYLHAYPYGGSRVAVFATPALVLLIAEGIVPVLAWLRTPVTVKGPLTAKLLSLSLPHSLANLALVLLMVLLLLPVGRAVKRALVPWPRADCAGAAAYVWAHRRAGEQVAANHWEYAYYFRELGPAFTLLDQSQHGFGERLWLVTTAPDQEQRLALARCLFPGDWHTLEQHEFFWSSVFLLSHDAAGHARVSPPPNRKNRADAKTYLDTADRN